MPKSSARLGKAVITGAAALAAAAFTAVLVVSLWHSPDLAGLVGGLVLGFVTGLVVLGVAAGATLFWLLGSVSSPDPAAADALITPIKPVLDELEATRRDTVREINRRARWRVPLCAVGAFALAGLDGTADLSDLVFTAAGGGFAGYAWASLALGNRYRSMYKQRVLPLLAARFGDITYRPAAMPDMRQLSEERLFRSFDRATAEDELAGTYRGLAVSIVELTLHVGSGDERRTSFDGLLVVIGLPWRLKGTTAVVLQSGLFDRVHDWLARNGRERVRLEDPRFENFYQVWGNDQIGARALLTPAFMERFLALGDRPGLGRPQALARDDRLLLTVPKAGGGDYFEPPSYLRPAASREAILRLDRDITGVLAMADAVIDLDQRSAAFGGHCAPAGTRGDA
ncbi:DUF3137 domain-containing protein [Mesorhizobium sp. BAC0120]|uniref:DUF3137 domain-containing protein n=1 Tax=Mesorhizobium sp. BAC0120 TaxID=3090670 RepID=UPI00298D35B8|nr:DUF3137 domain-containing protein [Mesorhizobium sp. BAC0120]MDW6023882.1 DUF3137 domain-containing protein [Mesorhizobium sp. BAC0120]